MMTLLELFWSFLQVGLFSIGGGYAAMPLIQAQVVEQHPWLTMSEFTDLITIAEMTPGPIAINSATFVGMRIAGVAGALVATVGGVLPSCIVSLLLAKLYLKYRSLDLIHGALGGLRPAVIALIASAGVTILLGALQTSAGGIGKAFGRMFSGESIFQNIYTARGGAGMIAFASSFPGSIREVEVMDDRPMLVQTAGFLAAEEGVELSIFFQKKTGAGFFGGEGFIMQKLSGRGKAFVEDRKSVV